jgi:signal transduction histidine kinase
MTTASASLSHRLYRSFGLLLALLLFLVGFSVYNFRKLAQANDLNVHTYQVLLTIGEVEERLYSIDSNTRAYLVGGGREWLQACRKDLAMLPKTLNKLRGLTTDNVKQQANLETIDQQRKVWVDDLLRPQIARRGSLERNQAIMAAGQSASARRQALNAILQTLKMIELTESELLRRRDLEQQRLQTWTQNTLILGGVFSMILTAGLVTIIAGSSRRLDEANKQLRSEKRRAEEANQQLLASNEALGSEIEQRRAAQEKLRENLVDLRRSNAELEQFAYVASHDLQEPLRAVSGCVQILQKRYEGQLDDRADQFIRHAVEGSQRMQNLINDLLSYSRVGIKIKEFELVEGERILSGALRNLSVAVRETEAQITHDLLPPLRCDAGQIEQVLQNLLSNAIKFRGEKPPRVHVGCTRQIGPGQTASGQVGAPQPAPEEGEYWVISVADQGPGIEPQYFERIFLMFQRLHTRVDYPGTGIGLAICKKIIERHGGAIWVESPPSGGSIFYFSLPAE